jgi:hypothetical protein
MKWENLKLFIWGGGLADWLAELWTYVLRTPVKKIILRNVSNIKNK